jgi:peptidoglycan hydrolase-like protein with peptidoglycan-binding domain/tellurite resistance protein
MKAKMTSNFCRYALIACLALASGALIPLTSQAQSPEVQDAQTFLIEEGYLSGTADGFMGPKTMAALEAFQTERNMAATGEIDATTLLAIEEVRHPPPPIEVEAIPQPVERQGNQWPTWMLAVVAGLLLVLLFGRRKSQPSKTLQPKADSARHSATGSASKSSTAQPLQSAAARSGLASPPIPRTTSKPKRQAWVANTESTTVGNRNIGGMVYVGAAPKVDRYGERCRAYIDPSLAVGNSGGDFEGTGLPYWPSYSSITARSRATYLDWLATGRSDPRYNVGYMFLYFYGLERRFFVDAPSQTEKQEILAEVIRLKNAYPDNYSVRNYLNRFVDAAKVSLSEATASEPIFQNDDYDLPLSLRASLGTRIVRDEPLNADWLLSWFMCHPERHLRTPATRCWEEFKTLFQIKFDLAYPNGMKVRKPKRVLKSSYRAASGEFEINLPILVDGRSVSDVSSLRQPVTDAQKLASASMDELDKFSRYLGRNPDGRGSLEAQALLPPALWAYFPSAELDGLKGWAENAIKSGGLAPALDLVERLEGKRPEKLGKKHFTGSADAMARLGFGIAPDPRYAIRSPKTEDPIVVFRLPENISALEEVSSEYRSALAEVALGTYVAQADGEVVPAEQAALEAAVQSAPNLSQSERVRLSANLKWLLAVPPDMAFLRQRMKDSTEAERLAFRRMAVFMASADSVIQPEEVGGIEKIYKALGLDVDSVYADLHDASMSSGLVRVRDAQGTSSGVAIPEQSPISGVRGVQLNAERINETQRQTADVSRLLGSIFASDEPEQDVDEEIEPSIGGILSGLDPKHSVFIRVLLDRDQWSEADYSELCQRHELMPSGALETVNEWAIEHFDDFLIEEYEGYEMNPDVAEQLRVQIQGA